jgi:hypothetical protein
MKNKIVTVAAIALFLAMVLSISCLPGLRAGEVMPEDISGTYIRETENELAKIEITLLLDGQVNVTGMAFWGTRQKYGPNIGELDFTSVLENNHIQYSEKNGQAKTYTLELKFTEKGLTAREEGLSEDFGLNVTFAGDYQKTAP